MPQLGADDACHNGKRDDPQRVGRLPFPVEDMIAAKAQMQHNCAADRSHPKHQAKGRDIEGTKRSEVNSKMDVRQHTYLSIVGGSTLADVAGL